MKDKKVIGYASFSKDTRNLFDSIYERIEYINRYGYCLSLNRDGVLYYIGLNNGKNECLNGYWSIENLQRMYDQTAGFASALIRIYGYAKKNGE